MGRGGRPRAAAAPAPRRGTPALAILVLACLVLAAAPAGPPAGKDDGGPVPGTDADLVVTDRTEVTGVQTYQRIRVGSTGTLVIPNGGSLVGTVMTMEGDARLEMTGGHLLLRGDPGGEPPSLTGSCLHMDLGPGSSLRVQGGNGTAGVDASAGAPALLSLSARTYITVSGSTLEVLGGHGLSPGAPLGPDGVVGDHCSGGDATLSLVAKGSTSALNIRSSTVRVVAGSGGDAPDGLPGGRGGGYSDGGPVGGRVGAGGNARSNLTSETVFLDGSTVTVSAGDGGDAGDGAPVSPGNGEHGGGGGGYSGGAGAEGRDEPAAPGGRVSGQVGSGGDAWLTVLGGNYQQLATRVLVEAGDGGSAGAGGDSMRLGGGGGGGYSGGGGGSSAEPAGGDGGMVVEGVASGGTALATLLVDGYARLVGSALEVVAGQGGDAGDGGLSTDMGGGGGGGYSAGGGAGSLIEPGVSDRPMYGGDGSPVTDAVATGGEARLRLNSTTGYLEDDLVAVVGGNGGQGGRAGRSWQDPDTDVWLGGGGGGSYSSGGGGAKSEYSYGPSAGGQAGAATGQVGDGGDGSLCLEIITPTIHANNSIACHRGEKGLCWRSAGAGDTGGDGGGRFTRHGRAHTHVPMGRTELLGPPDRGESMEVPTFSWKPLHASSTNGPVEDYAIEVAYDPSFDSPVHHTTVGNTSFIFPDLSKGLLFWRVTPLYSRPHQRAGIPTGAFVYTHLNSPPQVSEVPQVNITVRTPQYVDLRPYVVDVDDPMEDLVVTIDSNNVIGPQGFLVTFRYEAYRAPHYVYFNVSDGMATTRGRIPVRIRDDNHDPYLTGLGDFNPPVHVPIEEGDTTRLKVRYHDQDGDPVTIRLITPDWAGISLVEKEFIEIRAGFGDVGRYEATVIAEDDRGGRAQMTIVVRVGNVGEPPDPPEFRTPSEGSRYDEGDAVLFTIGVDDPDLAFGDTVNLTVISSVSGLLYASPVGGDTTFTTDQLGAGNHLITAVIVDGEFQERSTMTLVVVGEPEASRVWDPPDELWLILGLLAAALGGMAVSYWVGYRRRRARART